jgi:hypothetical protein
MGNWADLGTGLDVAERENLALTTTRTPTLMSFRPQPVAISIALSKFRIRHVRKLIACILLRGDLDIKLE